MNIIELILYVILYPGAFIQALNLQNSGIQLFGLLPFKKLIVLESSNFLIHGLIFTVLIAFLFGRGKKNNMKNVLRKLTVYITSLVSINGLTQLIIALVSFARIPITYGFFNLINNIFVRLIGSIIVYYLIDRSSNNEKK